VIQGSLDPWISLSDPQAKKMGRTSLPRIEYNTLNALKETNSRDRFATQLSITQIYIPKNVANLKNFYVKHGLRPNMEASQVMSRLQN
jgi:hypothetical protein